MSSRIAFNFPGASSGQTQSPSLPSLQRPLRLEAGGMGSGGNKSLPVGCGHGFPLKVFALDP